MKRVYPGFIIVVNGQVAAATMDGKVFNVMEISCVIGPRPSVGFYL